MEGQQSSQPKSEFSLPDILTVKPSRAITKFSQGKREIGNRSGSIVFGFVTFVSAASVLHHFNTYQGATYLCKGCENFKFLLSTGLLIIIYEALAIILRHLNVTVINKFSRISLLVDISINAVLCLFVLIGGSIYLSYLVGIIKDDPSGFIHTSEITLLISFSVLLFGVVVLFILMLMLSIWMLMFLIKKWNEKLTEQLEEEDKA